MTYLKHTLLHLRPRSFPVVFGHLCAGALMLLPEWKGDWHRVLWQVIVGGVLWTLCLNGGTLALNSAFDRDEGDIGYLDRPPKPPRGLAITSSVLMLIGVMAAFWLLPRGYGMAFGACVILSLLYSVPPIRLKAVGGPDLLINMAGYGALTFAAGALATGMAQKLAAGTPVLLVSCAFAMLFGAFYPMTQIYQIPEDTARGDTTLVVRVGARRALMFSIVASVICFALILTAAYQSHIRLLGMHIILLLGIAWVGFTADWLRRVESYPSQRGMYRALKLWGATDILVVVVWIWLR